MPDGSARDSRSRSGRRALHRSRARPTAAASTRASALHAENPLINGLTRLESNPDTSNEMAKALPNAAFQGQLDPDPDHHFPAVHKITALLAAAILRHYSPPFTRACCPYG